MENNRQIKKQLISNKHIAKPIVICYYKNKINAFMLHLIIELNCFITLAQPNSPLFKSLYKGLGVTLFLFF